MTNECFVSCCTFLSAYIISNIYTYLITAVLINFNDSATHLGFVVVIFVGTYFWSWSIFLFVLTNFFMHFAITKHMNADIIRSKEIFVTRFTFHIMMSYSYFLNSRNTANLARNTKCNNKQNIVVFWVARILMRARKHWLEMMSFSFFLSYHTYSGFSSFQFSIAVSITLRTLSSHTYCIEINKTEEKAGGEDEKSVREPRVSIQYMGWHMVLLSLFFRYSFVYMPT